MELTIVQAFAGCSALVSLILGYIVWQLRFVTSQIVGMRGDYYTKPETNEMIDLRMAPLNNSVRDIKQDVKIIQEALNNAPRVS